MTTTTATTARTRPFEDDLPGARARRAAPRPDRKAQAAVLSACALAIAVGVTAVFGTTGLFLFALTLPVPLMLLWASADVLRSDEM